MFRGVYEIIYTHVLIWDGNAPHPPLHWGAVYKFICHLQEALCEETSNLSAKLKSTSGIFALLIIIHVSKSGICLYYLQYINLLQNLILTFASTVHL